MASPNSPPPSGIPGIDVSHYQEQIDWAAVAQAGVRYSMIKASEGAGLMDPYFKRNWTGSRAAGVARGAYHFFRPKVAVTAQTDLFVKTVERLEPGDLPPALDLEAPADWAGIPVNRRVGLAVNWLESVEKQLGATPFVYLSPAFAEETIVDASPLARFPLWVAQYAPAPRIPKPWNRWTMWQHTQKGTVAGIQPALDLNWFQGSEDEFRGMLIGAAKESAPIAG